MVPEKNAGTAKKKTSKPQAAKSVSKPLKEKVEEKPVMETGEVAVKRDSENFSAEKEIAPPSEGRASAPFREGDDYTVLVRYDKNAKIFVGEVAEISECKVKGVSREEVLKELKIRLEDYIEDHRHQGGVPEPIFSRNYPESLSLRLSHSVYRKLDLLSRMEKVSLDQLALEILNSGVEKRLEPGNKGAGKHHQPNPSQQPRHNHHGGRHGGGHNRNRHNQNNLESRENFMEYVRNLEKGGNRWKK